jgi:hypothetical protein
MKKILLLIILAALGIGGFVFISNRSDIFKKGADEARGKAIDASLKVFAINTISDMATYYSDSKNPSPSYVATKSNMDKIDADFLALKAKYSEYSSEGFAYKISDEKENAAVKVKDSSRGIYVCIDSLTVKPTTISADQFDKKTDCSGTVLK